MMYSFRLPLVFLLKVNCVLLTASNGGTLSDEVGDFSERSTLKEVTFAAAGVEPHSLAEGACEFAEWSPDSPTGTYPSNMYFEQVQEGDPALGVEMDGLWELPYNLSSRSRVNGRGEDGVSFINTGNAQDVEGAGYLGSAVLALDTTGEENIRVQWTAGTVTPNSRVYGLRLQYRIGPTGSFVDVTGDGGQPFDYLRNEEAGHVELFGPVTLPSTVDNEPYVELRWKYYHVLGDSGPRAELRLDDILVSSSSPDGATNLQFENEPPQAGQSGDFLSTIQVRAVNDEGLTDVSFSSAVELTLAGDGQLNGVTTVTAEDGVAVFEGLSIEGAGSMTLLAETEGLPAAETSPFAVIRLIEEVMPQYIQGDQDSNNDNEDRLPFAFRLRLEGLLPHATYRYGNLIVESADPADQNGAGNAILITGTNSDWIRNTNAPRFGPDDFADRHLTFTTDSEGAFTGWFVTEPTGNGRFTPGNTLFVRLLLNDGAGGEDLHHFLTAQSGVEVRRLGGDLDEATSVYGDAEAGARNFVLLYDNETGSGRPLSATVVEETGAEVDSRYADFYVAQVATRQGRWGTLLPNSLSAGVRRVEERSLLTGETLFVHTFPEGLSGTVDPSGGVSPVFADLQGGVVFLPTNDGAWDWPDNWSGGEVPNAPDARAVVNMEAELDRTVSMGDSITLGALSLFHGTPFRNRLDGSSGTSLTFQSSSGEALLLAGGQGNGFHELRLDGGLNLNSDLRITVNNVAADGEYGALRIREAVTGPGALIKDGFGVLSLTGDDKNYTGETIVESGVLRVTESSQPRQTAGVKVSSGGQLRLVSHGEDRLYTFGGVLTLDSLGPDEGPVALPQAGRLGALRLDPELEIRDSNEDRHTATITSSIDIIGDSHVHVDGTANRLTLGGSVSGDGTLIKSGGGELVLTGDNSFYHGGTHLATGQLRAEAGSGLGQGPLTLEAADGADLNLWLENDSQTVSLLEADLGDGSSATVNLATQHVLNVHQDGDSRFQGSLTGGGAFWKSGEGILRLTRGPNDFTGSLKVQGGVLEVTEPSQPSAVSSVVVDDGGQLRLTSQGERLYTFGTGALILEGAGRDPAESAAKGALRQQGDDNSDRATVTNPIELAGGVAWIHTNRELGNGSILVLSGSISGDADLRKTGGGILELQGANHDFNGGVTIENGLLRVMEGSRLGTGPLTFVDPDRERILELKNEQQNVRDLSGAIEDDGVIQIVLSPHHALTVDQENDTVFEGALSGAGSFIKSGSGRLVLAGDHSMTGDVLVNSGVLRIDGYAASAGRLTIATDARLEGTGSAPGLWGTGTVAPGTTTAGIFEASYFSGEDGLGSAFVFDRTGGPDYESPSDSGNDVLRLSDEEPFRGSLGENNTISIYLDVDTISPGDVFRGGFFTDETRSFSAEIQNADFLFFLKDPDGDEVYRGRTYSQYAGSLDAIIDTVPENQGQVMAITWTEMSNFESWRDIYFQDPSDRDDPEVGGRFADVNGDGVSNLMKYALGLGPWDEVTHERLHTELDLSGRLNFRFFRDQNKSDIAYVVETSVDLFEWDVSFDSREFEGVNNSGDLHEVVVPGETELGRSHFVRLRIIQIE